jgi:tRNA dimethylallyltransferase
MAQGIVLIGGPTASGKSRLALELAEAVGGMVINADSMQVYRELRVLTARPTLEAEARAPHRLYGILPATEACSAARWRVLALEAIREAQAAGLVPILVGGTGLYFQALLKGLAPVPPLPAAVRREAERLFERLGASAFHAELARRDPEMAARLHPRDRQRLLRAYEVHAATGRSLADWQREAARGDTRAGASAAFCLMPPRPALYAACDARVLDMIERGALEEARTLAALKLDPRLPAAKTVGLRELIDHLEGRMSLAGASAKAQQATRRYAKRQLTWFRHRWREARLFTDFHGPEMTREALRELARIGLTGSG